MRLLKNLWNDRPSAREFMEMVANALAVAFATAAAFYGFYLLAVLILLLGPVY
jgi:putative methionine-R-sulfoxide reductase with GAF domain